jgi:5'-methylthioadenosine phosphorylase
MRGRSIQIGDKSVVIVRRHSIGHKVPPHKVRYGAIADGLRRLGVGRCFSTAAVGSLREDWPVGTLATCTDFLDMTGRGTTLFSRGVRHTDFTTPFESSGLLCSDDVRTPCVYACMNGPRYETPIEVAVLRKLGCDVVGMTVASEATVMREAGIAYGCLAVVTNMGCGLGGGQLSHGEVGDVMSSCGGRIVEILLEAVKKA